jgi:nucleoid-associated protein YgaU
MPNDAKLALAIGLGLVVAVAVIFFRKDLAAARPAGDKPPASVVNPPPALPPSPTPRVQGYPTQARTASRQAAPAAARRHTVAEGETLYDLAAHYYGDGERFVDLYQANRDVLKRPDRLDVGTVLVVPDLP